MVVFFFNQNPAYGMRISAGSSDVCSSDLERGIPRVCAPVNHAPPRPGQSPQGTNAGAVGGELAKEVAILPPTGMAAFAVGQMDLQRNYTLVDMKNKFNMSDNFEIENPLNLMTGTFDISFVVIFLDRTSTRLKSSNECASSMPSS